MDYLTNHYKNLCEQLQEKLNILEAQISEAMSEQEAMGMSVPILKSGKGGNYEEWRAAKDARNAALRKARMGGDREKVIGKLVRPEDLDKEAGTIDPKIPSDIFKPDYVLPGREPRMPRPGDRGPIPFNPDRKPLSPGMNPNPYIKPGLKPVNPSKIPSDMFRPGKRPKGEPNSFGIPTDTDRDDLFPGGRRPKSASEKLIDYYLHQDTNDRFRIGKRPRGGLLPAPERDDFPTPGTKPESIIPQPIRKGKIDYYLETQTPMRYGSLPKLGDSNLIGKIPTEQEAYGGRLMSTMQQSQVDLEGNPTGLVKNIPVKPKIDPRYKR